MCTSIGLAATDIICCTPSCLAFKCADARCTLSWHKLLNDIPENLLSQEQKGDAKAALNLYLLKPEERLHVFRRGHASAAQRIRGLLTVMPGAKLMTRKEVTTSHYESHDTSELSSYSVLLSKICSAP